MWVVQLMVSNSGYWPDCSIKSRCYWSSCCWLWRYMIFTTSVRSSRHCATKRRSDQAIYEAQIRNASAYRRKEQQCRNGRATERMRIINQNHVVYTFAFRAVWLTGRVLGWFSNRTETSVDEGKARGKDWTRLPVPNLLLCHWSSL